MHQEGIAIQNAHISNYISANYIKEITELQYKAEESNIIAGEINIPLPATDVSGTK